MIANTIPCMKVAGTVVANGYSQTIADELMSQIE